MSPRRKKGWETSLVNFLAANEWAPFVWGVHDCCRFACLGLVAQGLPDPMPAKFRRYKTAIGAAGAIRRLGGDGGLDAAATKLAGGAGLREVPTAFAGRGSVVLADLEVETAGGAVMPHLGLVGLDGLEALFVSADAGLQGGYRRVPLAGCRRAWKVD